jgi:uncharacterized protein YdhG (YjbR/CyaY superfamily)
MVTKRFNTLDEYLASVPPAHRVLLKEIRKIIKKTAPTAEELISYNMPGYKYKGMLLYFASFTNHCSLFPASREVFTNFAKELKDYKTSKGTIQFSTGNPLPAGLVKRIVSMRLKQNEEKAAKKAMAKK